MTPSDIPDYEKVPESVFELFKSIMWMDNRDCPAQIPEHRKGVAMAVAWDLGLMERGSTDRLTAIGLDYYLWCKSRPPMRDPYTETVTESVASEESIESQVFECEEAVPSEFRDGGKPDGQILFAPYLKEHFDLSSKNLTDAWNAGDISIRAKVKGHGRKHCYTFKDVSALARRLNEAWGDAAN